MRTKSLFSIGELFMFINLNAMYLNLIIYPSALVWVYLKSCMENSPLYFLNEYFNIFKVDRMSDEIF